MAMDPVELLEGMLRIPSTSTNEAEVAQFLVRAMADLGFESFVDAAGNAVGIAGAGPEIVLLGHIDTVPGVVPVRVEGGMLYGRGAVDAKGPFATFVCAAARLIAEGPPRRRIVLVGAVEEEAASSKGAHYAAGQYRPEACIIGEPSGWDRLTLGYKGRLLVDGRWEQPMAHSAGSTPAVAERAVDFWNAVAAHCAAHNQGRQRLFDQLLPSLRAISSGSDGLADWAALTVGVRLPPDLSPDALADTIAALAGGGAELRFHDLCPAYQGDKNNPLVRALLRGVRAAGGQPGFLLKTGTSDMNVVGPAWGCPILAYGPGDSALDHTPVEHVEVAEYLRAIDVLTIALRELCGGA
jgi:[amino group carrier protein]-lysine/ornithine hydrolase